MKVPRHTDFFGRKCSDLGVGRWVSCNLNVVQICKSIRNIRRSLRQIMGKLTLSERKEEAMCLWFEVKLCKLIDIAGKGCNTKYSSEG